MNALILTGGCSSRMGRDKALLSYRGDLWVPRLYQLLGQFCSRVFLSVSKEDQWRGTPLSTYPQIVDQHFGRGPLNGVLSALDRGGAWLVLACDMPLVSRSSIDLIVKERSLEHEVTMLTKSNRSFEPLFAIYEPGFRALVKSEDRSLVEVLRRSKVKRITVGEDSVLKNINETTEYQQLVREIS